METAIEYLKSKDGIFEKIIHLYGVPKIPYRPEGFETLVLLILEQQVSVDVAKATFLKLKNGVNHILPEVLIPLSEADFRLYGVSRQKAKYIHCLAEAVLNKQIHLDQLSSKNDETIRNELIKIKGIGHWTIDIYLMFCLKSPDILPLGDIAVSHTIKELTGLTTQTEMAAYTENWKPFRTMATYLLWHYYLKKRNRTISYDLE